MKSKFFSWPTVITLLSVGIALHAESQPPQANVTGGASAPIAIVSGTPTKIATTAPGQSTKLTFNAKAGQGISLSLTNSTYSAHCVQCVSLVVSVLRPDGVSLGTTLLGKTSATSGFLNSSHLPLTGTYTIAVQPQNAASGSMTAKLFVFSDQVEEITAGVPVTVTTTIPGQKVRLMFTGAAGQQASLSLTNSSFGTCAKCNAVAIRIHDPRKGPALGWTKLSNNVTSASIRAVALPSTGAYSVVIDPQGSRTGSAVVNLTLQ